MKKVFVTGMLAVCLIAATQQQASAWVHCKFGIGLNLEHQGGGNSFFWGLWKSGQPPGPEAYGMHSPAVAFQATPGHTMAPPLVVHNPPPVVTPPPVVIPPPTVVVPAPPVVVPAPPVVVPAPHVPHAYAPYGNVPYAYSVPAFVPYAYSGQGAPATTYMDPSYAGMYQNYGSPFHFATYPRQTYYQPNTWYQR